MAESIFEAINNPERMGQVLDHANAPTATSNDLKAWLKDPESKRLVQEVWEQAMCLAYIDGNETAAEWLKKRVKDPKHKLPSAAQEFYEIYQRCKERS